MSVNLKSTCIKSQAEEGKIVVAGSLVRRFFVWVFVHKVQRGATEWQ